MIHANQLENDLRGVIPGDYDNGDGNRVVVSVVQVTTVLPTLIRPQSVTKSKAREASNLGRLGTMTAEQEVH